MIHTDWAGWPGGRPDRGAPSGGSRYAKFSLIRLEPDGGRSAGDGRQGSTKRRTGIAIIHRPPYSASLQPRITSAIDGRGKGPGSAKKPGPPTSALVPQEVDFLGRTHLNMSLLGARFQVVSQSSATIARCVAACLPPRAARHARSEVRLTLTLWSTRLRAHEPMSQRP